jgi:hypothetical protein
MNKLDRIKFYLGENLVNGNFKLDDDKFQNINDLQNNESYNMSLKNLLIKSHNEKQSFKFLSGDISGKTHNLTLCKNRATDCIDGVILRCLNFNRHWDHYYNKPQDIPFKEKKNIIFWRGTTTGQIDRKTGNRFDLITKWFNKNKNIDIGFSSTCQNKDAYKKYVKGSCDIPTFLTHKYILSIEGNDKDSGLQWKLNSNSVVLMTKPRITSWLMETTLQPNYHYVLLKDDFSDLEEKLNWCNNNQQKCVDIVKNANKFMSQFSNNDNELKLEIDVINNYFKILNTKIGYI